MELLRHLTPEKLPCRALVLAWRNPDVEPLRAAISSCLEMDGSGGLLMSRRSAAVAILALVALSGCAEEVPKEPASESPTGTPFDLTCPTNFRSVSTPPYFDEAAPGAKSPESAVETWLGSDMGRGLGPDYALDESRTHAWILRTNGTAEARVTVKLTVGGGYFYFGHEACG